MRRPRTQLDLDVTSWSRGPGGAAGGGQRHHTSRSRHHFTAGAQPQTGQHEPLEFPVAVATSERGKGNHENATD